MLLATTLGSVCGLVFGLTSLNRPLQNAAVFYLLGAALGAVLGAALVLVAGRARQKASSSVTRRGSRRGVDLL